MFNAEQVAENLKRRDLADTLGGITKTPQRTIMGQASNSGLSEEMKHRLVKGKANAEKALLALSIELSRRDKVKK